MNEVEKVEIETTPKQSRASKYLLLGICLVVIVLLLGTSYRLFTFQQEANKISPQERVLNREVQVREIVDIGELYEPEQVGELERGLKIDKNILSMNHSKNRGFYLVDAEEQRPLYYINDTKSACAGSCFDNMNPFTSDQPYLLSSTTRDIQEGRRLASVRVSEGVYQYAWDGYLLYFYVPEEAENVSEADMLSGFWKVAKP
ncbi:hypothetical protein H6785_02440 [Candidatus Nomurabacteria bacterium]|nr:hypothetical protein [Candidatus Kaiserbacteria bacterium]MCB9815408.1 hypothetical protein [Candidatus Nomurabacteria bacterium]